MKDETRFAVRFGEHPSYFRRWPTAQAERYVRCDAGITALSVLACFTLGALRPGFALWPLITFRPSGVSWQALNPLDTLRPR